MFFVSSLCVDLIRLWLMLLSGGSVVVGLLLPLWDSVIVLRFVVRYFVSNTSFAIILIGKRELVALLSLSSWCLVNTDCCVALPCCSSAVCVCGIS